MEKLATSDTLIKRKAMVCPMCAKEQKKKEKNCRRCGSRYMEGWIWEKEGGQKERPAIPY